jgi:polyisoprenoid-binding protein YceI
MKKLTWVISEADSRLSFKLNYYQFGHISGQFVHFNGRAIANRFFDNPEIYLFIDAHSIETHYQQLNEILRSKEILNVEKYPYFEFSSLDGCSLKSGRIWEMTADLMIKDVKKPLTLIINYSDIKVTEQFGLATFRLFGNINLKDFGFVCAREGRFEDSVSFFADMVLHAAI